jgi:hypothetical protein
MKTLTPVDEFIDDFARKRVRTWLDKLSFPAIILVWVTAIITIGLAYYLFTNDKNYLYYNLTQSPVEGLLNHIYFSFTTAIAAGFGDIIPRGIFKTVSVIEVVTGLLMLAVVMSKFVSLKQNMILEEIYELSFSERVNRVRSSLLVYRQNLGRIISRIEEGVIKKREINDLYVHISSFEDILHEIEVLISRKEEMHFTKVLDPLNAELIFGSAISSFEKLHELILVLDQNNKKDWRRDVTVHLIYKCIMLNQKLFDQVNSSKMLPEKNLADLNAQKSKVVDAIRTAMNVPEEKVPETIIVK